MPQTANYILNELDETLTYSEPRKNVSGFIGDFEMGPINDPEIIITSPAHLAQIYGNIKADNSNADCYLQAVMALKKGSALRICNIRNYSDLTDRDTCTAVKADADVIQIASTSAPIGVGHTIKFTILGYEVSQTFSVSHANTLSLLINKVKNNPFTRNYVLFIALGAANTLKYLTTSPATVTVTGSGAPTVTVAETNAITNDASEPLIAFTPKYAGAKYNDLLIEITSPSNRLVSEGYFNLKISLLNSIVPPEVFVNLQIQPGMYELGNYMNDFNQKSKLVDLVKLGTSLNHSENTHPIPISLKYTGGTDGSAITAEDIVGNDITKLGIYAFDGYDDISRIGCGMNLLNKDIVQIALASYAANRKDIFAVIELRGETVTDITTQRDLLGIDSSYARFYSSGLGLKELNPKTKELEYIGCTGAVLGASAYTASNFGFHYSYAGENRGLISVTSVGNQWGNDQASLETLAYAQVNQIIKRNGQVMIWGNFTAQKKQSVFSYASIRDNFIGIRKALNTIFGPFLEELNDIQTWKYIDQAVTPLRISLKNSRAAMELPTWEGDQNASNYNELTINNITDVQTFGKYKAVMRVAPTNSLQLITIDVVATAAGISITEN